MRKKTVKIDIFVLTFGLLVSLASAAVAANTNIVYAVQHWAEYVDGGLNPGYAEGTQFYEMTYGGVTTKYYLFAVNDYNDGVSNGTKLIVDLVTDDFGDLSVDGLTDSGANVYSVTMQTDGSSVFPFYYDRNGYTITFDPNGGSINANDAEMNVAFGGLYGVLPSANRDEYELMGWYTDPHGGKIIFPGATYNIAGDQTLYAHWFPDGNTPYTVVHMRQELKDNTVGYEKNPENYGFWKDEKATGTADTVIDIYAFRWRRQLCCTG